MLRTLRIAMLCMTALSTCLPESAHAQIGSGTILGTVRDETTAVVTGAEITARRVATDETFTALTGGDGNYRLFPILTGEYEVSAAFPGFRTSTKEGIVVEVGQTVRVEFVLRVGDASESITVTGAAPLINTDSASVGQVIDNQKLVALPLNSRDFATLATLTPSVLPPRGSIYGSGPATGPTTGMSVRGQRRSGNVFYLDGSMISEGNGATTFLPNIDALQEFEIKTGLYGAEYGIRPGGQVIAVTKSGTNTLHGSAFEFHQNEDLSATNFFQQSKTEFTRNQFGGTVGGPIYIPRVIDGSDKAWFFGAYQNERIRRIAPLTGVVPTAAERNGRFATAITDPLTGESFPDNAIPSDRISPAAQRLLAFWPEPNTAGALNFTSPDSTQRFDNSQVIARVDFKTSTTSRWTARFVYDSKPVLRTDAIADFSDTLPLATWLQSISNTRTLSDRLVNVASLHFFRRTFRPGADNPHVEATQALGIPALRQDNLNPGVALPRFGVQGMLGIGDQGGPAANAVNIGNWQIRDDVSFQTGAHLIKTGVEYRRHYNFFNLSSNPTFSFTGRFTGNPFADFLLGLPMTTRTGGESLRGSFAQNSVYLYLQDDWRVGQRLTVNVGVRYEWRLPWRDKRGFMSNVDPATGLLNPPLQNLTLAPGETGRFEPDAPLVEWRPGDGLLPRSGFAYRLGEETVLRGGYGVYSNEPDVADIQALGGNPRPNAAVRVFNASATSPDISVSDPFPADLAASAVPTLTGMETPLKLTKAHSYGVSVQHQLGRDWAVEIGYQGTRTVNVVETISFNDATPGTGPRQLRRPFPEFQSIIYNAADGKIWYDAMEVKVQKRPGRDGLFVLGAFTWSKTLENVSLDFNVLAGDRQRSRNMPLDRNKATSDFHIPRRLVITAGYELPFGAGKPFLSGGLGGKILGGWSIQGIAVFQDGPWITVSLPGDAIDTGSTASQRPDLLRDPNLPSDERTLQRWFDTSAFARPTGFVYGNAGRSTVEAPGLKNLDVSIQRRFDIGAGGSLQLRVDGFNILNHTNLGLPGRSFGTPAFGVIGSALDPRIIQLGVKYSF